MYANEKTFKTLLELGAVASFRLYRLVIGLPAFTNFSFHLTVNDMNTATCRGCFHQCIVRRCELLVYCLTTVYISHFSIIFLWFFQCLISTIVSWKTKQVTWSEVSIVFVAPNVSRVKRCSALCYFVKNT